MKEKTLTDPKTNIQITYSSKEEFKGQVTAEGEEMNVRTVIIDILKK